MPIHDGEERSSSADAGAYFKELVNEIERLRATHGRVRVELATDSVHLGITEVVPAGLCVNELVQNAFEHGFPDGRSGIVRVSLSASADGDVLLRVADDGVGFPVEAREAASGLGLPLVRMLAEQLSAKLELDSSPGQGTDCCLRFRSIEESKPWRTS
jgi:two-component sensor histidine kinase